MYTNPAINSAAPIGVLAMTGFGVAWWIIAGVALIGAGAALLRFVPRQHS